LSSSYIDLVRREQAFLRSQSATRASVSIAPGEIRVCREVILAILAIAHHSK